MRPGNPRAALGWAVAVGVVAWAVAAPAAEAPPAPGPESAAVTVLGIRASTEAVPHIDPALQAIAEELKRFNNYNSFRLIANDTRTMPVGQPVELRLIEGWAIRIQPEKVTEESVQLTISWSQYVTQPDGKVRAVKLAVLTKIALPE